MPLLRGSVHEEVSRLMKTFARLEELKHNLAQLESKGRPPTVAGGREVVVIWRAPMVRVKNWVALLPSPFAATKPI